MQNVTFGCSTSAKASTFSANRESCFPPTFMNKNALQATTTVASADTNVFLLNIINKNVYFFLLYYGLFGFRHYFLITDLIPLYLSIFINNKGPAFRSGRPADQPEQRFLGNGGMEAKAFVRLPAVQFLPLISIPAEQRVLIPGIKIVSVAPAEIVNGSQACRPTEIETDPDIVLPARTEKGQRVLMAVARFTLFCG